MTIMNGYSSEFSREVIERLLYRSNAIAATPKKSFALSTTTFDLNLGGMTEPSSATGYARANTTTGIFSDPGGAPYFTVSTTGQVVFPVSDTSWGTIRALMVFSYVSSPSNTANLFGGPLDTAKAVPINSVVVFLVGQISISIYNGG